MTVPRPAFSAYAPSKSQLAYIDADRHPEVFRVVTDGHSGSTSTESRMWLAAYERFGDDFEEAARRYDPPRHEGMKGKLHPYIDDPWKLTGYAHDEVSQATHYVATMAVPPLLREGNYSPKLSFVMRTVARYGMAPDSLVDCAMWYSRGTIVTPEAWTYRLGWATLLFGQPASTWTGDDLAWLVEYGNKQAFQDAYAALTGVTSAYDATHARLPFSLLKAVLTEGLAPEYAKEMMEYAERPEV